MQYIEYPKMLYRGEEQKIVTNADHEESSHSEGWRTYAAPILEAQEAEEQADEQVVEENAAPAKRQYRRKAAVTEQENAV